jgi:hypothetical protein
MLTVKSNDGVTSSRNTAESLTYESADEIRSPAPRFVVWAGPLKSLSFVTVRKLLFAEICDFGSF